MRNKKFILYNFIIFTSLLSSCYSYDNNDIIPRQRFITILTELHIADAILTERGFYDRKLKDSTDSYYNFILIKHNMSRKKFDKNLMYYAQNMEDFTLLYDEVIGNIDTQIRRFKLRKSFYNIPLIVLDSIDLATRHFKKLPRKSNLWNKKKNWYLPKDGRLNTIEFEKSIYGQSKFELSADIVIFTDDQSVNPVMLIEILYKDASKEIFKDTTLVKDGKWHTYKLTAETSVSKTPRKITCKIVNHDKGTIKKHLEVNNIFLVKHLLKRKAEFPEEKYLQKQTLKAKIIK